MQGLGSRIAIAMYKSCGMLCEVIFLTTSCLLDCQEEMPKSNAIHRLPARILHRNTSWLYTSCRPSRILYSLGVPAAAAGSSGNATKLSSPLNFLFEPVVSCVDWSCGCNLIRSIGSGRKTLSSEEFVPQPVEEGSDSGQSFPLY